MLKIAGTAAGAAGTAFAHPGLLHTLDPCPTPR